MSVWSTIRVRVCVAADRVGRAGKLCEFEAKLHRHSRRWLEEWNDLVSSRKLSALTDRQHAAGWHCDHRGWPAAPPPAPPLRPVIVQLPRRCGLHCWRDAAVGQRAARSEWQVGKNFHFSYLKVSCTSFTFSLSNIILYKHWSWI